MTALKQDVDYGLDEIKAARLFQRIILSASVTSTSLERKTAVVGVAGQN